MLRVGAARLAANGGGPACGELVWGAPETISLVLSARPELVAVLVAPRWGLDGFLAGVPACRESYG